MWSLRRILASAVLTLVTVILTASCGLFGDSGPTAADAGRQLRKDVQKLLDKTPDAGDLSIQNVEIARSARRNLSCQGSDEARRRFKAHAALRLDGGNVDQDLDQATSEITVLLDELGYEVQRVKGFDPPDDRRIIATKKEERLRITVRMSGDGATYQVAAQTSCLPTK